MTHGQILVVLPTLGDRLEMLKATLDSVEGQRGQVDLKLVVILPAEATDAKAIASRYDAVVVDDPREGISTAINTGLKTATTERYYAWIGDDDLFRPGGLEVLRSLIEEADDNVVAYGGCDYIDPHGRTVFTSRAGRLAYWLQPWGPNLLPHPGSLIRLDDMAAVGFFDPKLKYSMDLDLFLKLRRRGHFVATKTSVSAFRWHPESATVSNRKASTAEARAVKRKHLPSAARPFTPMWETPVGWAASYAARSVSRRAQESAESSP